VEVEHEVGEGAFKTSSLTEVNNEAGAGDFGGAVEVENAESFAKLPVRFGGEVKLRLLTPGFFFMIAVFVLGKVCMISRRRSSAIAAAVSSDST